MRRKQRILQILCFLTLICISLLIGFYHFHTFYPIDSFELKSNEIHLDKVGLIDYDFKVTICACAKYEERYIDEWIKYHLLLGFDQIYIYDNSDNKSLFNYLNYDNDNSVYNGKINLIHFPGNHTQIKQYNDCLNRNKNNDTLWIAIFDIDEFIVLKKHKNIKEFLNEYNTNTRFKNNSLSLSRFCFGSNGHLNYSLNNEGVLNRYIYREINSSQGVKSIIYVPNVRKITNPHFAKMKQNGHGHIIIGNNMSHILKDHGRDQLIYWHSQYAPKLFDNECKIACINHYNLKSLQYWKLRIKRGNGHSWKKHSINQWIRMNQYCNQGIDTFARDWFNNHQ